MADRRSPVRRPFGRFRRAHDTPAPGTLTFGKIGCWRGAKRTA